MSNIRWLIAVLFLAASIASVHAAPKVAQPHFSQSGKSAFFKKIGPIPQTIAKIDTSRTNRKRNRNRRQNRRENQHSAAQRAIQQKRDQASCKKWKSLYEKRKQQGGVWVIDLLTGKKHLSKDAKAKAHILTTKSNMNLYCYGL